jgi:hypothetical protein
MPPVNVIDGPLTTFLRDERTIDYVAVRNGWAIDHVATLVVDPAGAPGTWAGYRFRQRTSRAADRHSGTVLPGGDLGPKEAS